MIDKLVNLTEYNSALEAAEITTLLDAQGIAYILENKDSTNMGMSDSVSVRVYQSDLAEAELLLTELLKPSSSNAAPTRFGLNAFSKDDSDVEFNNRFQYTFERYNPQDHHSIDPERNEDTNNHSNDPVTTDTQETVHSKEESKRKLEDVLKKYIGLPFIAYIIIKIILALLK